MKEVNDDKVACNTGKEPEISLLSSIGQMDRRNYSKWPLVGNSTQTGF